MSDKNTTFDEADGAVVGLPELSEKVDGIADDLKDHKKSVHRDIRDLWIGLLALAALTAGALVVTEMNPRKSDVVTRDDTVEALLTPGVHCFGSSGEMAAARQRALAAIDRINWEFDKPAPTNSPEPPKATMPENRSRVVEATQPGLKRLDDRDVDNDTCFGIKRAIE